MKGRLRNDLGQTGYNQEEVYFHKENLRLIKGMKNAALDEAKEKNAKQSTQLLLPRGNANRKAA